MKFNITCKHESAAPAKLMETLDPNQGGPGRHKCCQCSFEAGLNSVYTRPELIELSEIYPEDFSKCPHGSIAPSVTLIGLKKAQGGVVRHRCATCAYWRAVSSLEAALTSKFYGLVLTSPNFTPFKISSNNRAPRKGVFVDSDRNSKLGHMGELATISYEKQFLSLNNKRNLADKIEHTSMVSGDEFGYDIKSYNLDGTDKWIEVKTTTGTSNSYFHISENQISVSEDNPEKFHLYRVYDFDTETKVGSLYTISGDLRSQLMLSANSYKALPRN